MQPIEQLVTQALRDQSQDVEPSSQSRILNHVLPMVDSPPRRHLGSWAVAAALVAAVVVVTLNAVGVLGTSVFARQGPPPPMAAQNGLDVVGPGQPCRGAQHGSVAALSRSSELPIWLPPSGTKSVTDGWTCGGGGGEPVLMFGNIQVSYEGGWENVPIPKKWQALADDYGGYVATVNGLPAYVHPTTKAGPNNEVLFVKNGTLVAFLARGNVPIDHLVNLANSLDLSHRYVAPA